MNNRLFILNNREKLQEVKNQVKENDSIMTFDFDIRNNLKKTGINIISTKEYIDKDILNTGVHWLKEWANQKTIGDLSFKEFCIYNGISYWWFCDTLLWYHVLHKRNFYSIFYYSNIFLNLIEKENITEIIAYSDNVLINDLLKEIGKKLGIKIKVYSSKIKKLRCNKSPRIIEKLKEKKFKIRQIISKKVIKNTENKDLIFTTYTSLCKNNEDIFLKDIVKEIQGKIDFNLIDLDYTKDIKNIKNGIQTRKEKNYLPFEYFYTKDKESRRVFKEKWNQIKNNIDFQQSLEYKGLSFWEIIKPQFEFIFLNRLPESADYIKTAEKMLETLQPKAVFLIDETFMYGRSIIHAAKQKNIKSIALQHGLISPQSFEYINYKEENPKLNPPLADTTLVMGEYSKNLLINNSNYTNINITGQPRYESFKREDVENSNQEIKVTLMSQPLTDEAAGDYIETAFSAFKELTNIRKDIKFTIKVHPREESLKYYEDLAKKNNLEIEIVRDVPIDKVINESTAIIILHSAVGIEALLLKKPLIVLNTTGKADVYPYDEGRKIPKCENKEELVKVLSKIEELEYDKEFLQEHIHFPKEGVVRKIINIINNSIKPLG